MIRVLLADDHELTRRGVREVLCEDPDFVVVGEAGDGIEAWELVQTLKPDVALIDVRMGGIQGPALCQLITSHGLTTACIILTSYTDEEPLGAALANGARGYIIKDIGPADLIQSIRRILAGGAVLDPRAASQVLGWLREGCPGRVHLVPVDAQILSFIAQGWTNREIGATLHFSENTVKVHITRMIEQLHAKNRVEAAVIAYRQGLI